MELIPLHGSQVIGGMDRLGSRGSAEQPGNLRETFIFGLLGKGQVLAVGLAFPCKCSL